jgi:hypothetical protein
MDLARGSNVVLVTGACPGRGRAGRGMVLLLASPLSSWTTGQVVLVNGGYAMV